MSKLFWGIKKKIMLYQILILLGAFLCSYLAVSYMVQRVIADNLWEKYQYMNEMSVLRLGDYFQESDALMEKFISSSVFQDSLRRENLSTKEAVALRRELSYMTLSFLERSLYVDNKENLYGEIPAGFCREHFAEWLQSSGLYDTYSSTIWLWTPDIGGLDSEKRLYAGRLLRHMEYPYLPGVIIMNLDNTFLGDVLEGSVEEGVQRYVLTNEGEICYALPASEELSDELAEWCRRIAVGETIDTGEGLVLSAREERSGFTILTWVPEKVLNAGLNTVRLYTSTIFLVVCIVAYFCSKFFSRSITLPVEQINEVMARYSDTSAREYLTLNSGTELDTIGENYNAMVDRISAKIEEIKNNEREMYKLQLDSLMYQINPHFLYNILDNIYMMARMNGDERIMTMIQSLSNFLRIGLSNGRDVIQVKDELEHVQSYVEIQRMRNRELFNCEISCADGTEGCYMLKFLLQPLVENAVKHGFAHIQTGGVIRVAVSRADNKLYCSVWDNGISLDEVTLGRLNRLQKEPLGQMQNYFQSSTGGYGVVNVVKRLRLRYEDDFAFYYKNEKHGVSCVVVIPIEDEGEV